jgi:hypothetical protein
VDPRVGLDDMEKGKFLPLPRQKLNQFDCKYITTKIKPTILIYIYIYIYIHKIYFSLKKYFCTTLLYLTFVKNYPSSVFLPFFHGQRDYSNPYRTSRGELCPMVARTTYKQSARPSNGGGKLTGKRMAGDN